MTDIVNASIPFPDFKLQEVIDPEQFDSNNAVLVNKLNELIASINSFDDTDGAGRIGAIQVGTSGTNVQSVLTFLNTKIDSLKGAGYTNETLMSIKQQIQNVVLGQIPDGTITQAKLAFEIASNATSVVVDDTGNYFTSTNAEGALQEIGQTLNSMRGSLITSTNNILGT